MIELSKEWEEGSLQGKNRSWAEISLQALSHNLVNIRNCVSSSTKIMAVVKADAYGHGAVSVAKYLVQQGVDYLAVSLLEEALELRSAGITSPILILSYVQPSLASLVIRENLSQTIYDEQTLQIWAKEARKQGRKAKIHIKIDTGMGRIGFAPSSLTSHLIQSYIHHPFLEIEGLFTHFSVADSFKEEDIAYTFRQFYQFKALLTELEKKGCHIPLKHCCNSAALLRWPEFHLDMVRPGIILYGYTPFFNASNMLDTYQKICFPSSWRPVMSLHSRIIQLRRYRKATSLGYGATVKVQEGDIIATVSIGYADGYIRGLSNKISAVLASQVCPQVGTICMDMCMFKLNPLLDKYKLRIETTSESSCEEEFSSALLESFQEKDDFETDRSRAKLQVEEAGFENIKLHFLSEKEGSAYDEISVGTEVLLFGENDCPKGNYSLTQWLKVLHTIPYEILCSIGQRVPRIYKE